PGFSPFTKYYDQIISWQGKELRMAVQILCVTLAVALHDPAASKKMPFAQVQRAVLALVSFISMAQYSSHDNETISLMEQYWQQFHHEKVVFLEFRPKKLALKMSERYARDACEEA